MAKGTMCKNMYRGGRGWASSSEVVTDQSKQSVDLVFVLRGVSPVADVLRIDIRLDGAEGLDSCCFDIRLRTGGAQGLANDGEDIPVTSGEGQAEGATQTFG